MSDGIVHVVGAGLAGLSAATLLSEAGRRVVLHEAAKAAGGRCRSYHDATLGLEIDNGNHLLLSGNRAAMAYLRRVRGLAALEGPDEAAFDFVDLGTDERWRLRPNDGLIPWWVATPSRRVPGSAFRDYLAPIAILRAKAGAAIGEAMACTGLLWRCLWQPVLLAILNTEPERGDAGITGQVLRESLCAGGRACRPLIATRGLSAAFVDPALAWLEERGTTIRFGTRLRSVEREGALLTRLVFADDEVTLGPDDTVILAVPPWVAADLLPEIPTPTEFRGILNAHYAVPPPAGSPLMVGIVGGLAEWLFSYRDRLSVTISAGDRLFDTPREELARMIWADVARVSGLPPQPMPPWQIVKEKRATFAATPAMERLRPSAETAFANLVLAGDWTKTGLPATIEGAIRSGENAAMVVQRSTRHPAAVMAKTAA